MDIKYVFSLKLCGFLCLNGFPVKGVKPNLKMPNKSVYVFENTKRLNDCIELYNENYSAKEKKNDRFKEYKNKACTKSRSS